MLASFEEEKSEIAEADDELELSKYCFYNKFLLVEELALERNFLRLHQGRCTVIGKLGQHQDGYLILESIRLTQLPRKYSLPEGTISVRIFQFVTWDVEFKLGQYCEVIGEVVLWNPNSSRDNWLRLTPRGALEYSQNCEKNARKEKVEQLQRKYIAAINVFRIDYIDCAAELVQRNLRIRLLTTNNVIKKLTRNAKPTESP